MKIKRRDLLKATLGAAGIAAVPLIQKIRLAPEDVVVFNSPEYLDEEALAELRDQLRLIFGRDRKIVILEGGATIEKMELA